MFSPDGYYEITGSDGLTLTLSREFAERVACLLEERRPGKLYYDGPAEELMIQSLNAHINNFFIHKALAHGALCNKKPKRQN